LPFFGAGAAGFGAGGGVLPGPGALFPLLSPDFSPVLLGPFGGAGLFAIK
jgi:hypothetical protein